MMREQPTTKAQVLEFLGEKLEGRSEVLPLLRVAFDAWRDNGHEVSGQWQALVASPWPAIVRSSAIGEDSETTSMAGAYLSVANVQSRNDLHEAVEAVFASYGSCAPDDEVLIQPMLERVVCSGVAFSHDPNTGGHWYVINYDRHTGSTSSVTSGNTNEVQTFYHHHDARQPPKEKNLAAVISLVDEIRDLLNYDAVDIEFAIDDDGRLFLLQARPLNIAVQENLSLEEQAAALTRIERKIDAACRRHPFLLGERTIFGVMPDWNPAEIIGVRPRTLAHSLYRELVTDNIWAYQRNNYGYRNLRSFPLMVSFMGLPYIDVRTSFNSFIPASMPDDLAEKLVTHYLSELEKRPSQHDKVEFEIIRSCYTLDLPQKLEALPSGVFSAADRTAISDSLRDLTNRIIHREEGLWKRDLGRISNLSKRRKKLLEGNLPVVEQIYWLLEDCKRYGTLPFAGLARAGFIAVQLLQSLEVVGVLEGEEVTRFMHSLETVSSQMAADYKILQRDAFLEKYGHLRPGTYDILSPRYDQEPDLYFPDDTRSRAENGSQLPAFALSLAQMQRLESLLENHGITQDVVGLLSFIKTAIESRELAKFEFTKNVSDVLELIAGYGEELGFSREDLSYLDAGVIQDLVQGTHDPVKLFKNSINLGKSSYRLCKGLVLPPLISRPSDVWSFHLPEDEPNFITQESVTAALTCSDRAPKNLEGAIIMIPNADPGYDWLFTRGIGGLVTQFGGVNSHMAIRCAEQKIPAVIGLGTARYEKLVPGSVMHMDCSARLLQKLDNG